MPLSKIQVMQTALWLRTRETWKTWDPRDPKDQNASTVDVSHYTTKADTDPTNTSPMTFKHPRDCQNVVWKIVSMIRDTDNITYFSFHFLTINVMLNNGEVELMNELNILKRNITFLLKLFLKNDNYFFFKWEGVQKHHELWCILRDMTECLLCVWNKHLRYMDIFRVMHRHDK